MLDVVVCRNSRKENDLGFFFFVVTKFIYLFLNCTNAKVILSFPCLV